MFPVRRFTSQAGVWGSEAVRNTGALLPKLPRKRAAAGFCEIGSPHTNEPSLITKTISKSSVATARNDIEYMTADFTRRTFTRSTTQGISKRAGVSCRPAGYQQVTSCLLKRSPWKRTRTVR